MDRHPRRRMLSGFDTLDGPERDEVLRHVAACGSCRAVWSATDPSRLFALLGTQAPLPAALDRLSARIEEELDGLEAETAGVRHGSGWASLAASVLLAVAIGGYLFSRPDTPVATASPVGLVALEDRSVGSGVEVMTPAEAEVFDVTVGDTQIVMIFDERLDI